MFFRSEKLGKLCLVWRCEISRDDDGRLSISSFFEFTKIMIIPNLEAFRRFHNLRYLLIKNF